ncbi:MAG TPA: CpcT/CpeT family chromophore lyase [Thermoanaerobaculia bacterium]|nr:CpcT/CpeT family chromophore lyase [Thermoanaerobaculia bacterium]
MSLRAALAAALMLPAALTPAAEPSPAVSEVAGLLPGVFVSRDPSASIRFSVAAVPKNRIAADAPVFYLEAAKSARPDAPFLQRFLKLEAAGAVVAVRVYEPRDLAGVRGKWREPEALAVFTERDVRERPDCRMTLKKAPAGHWTGGTAAATCFSPAAGAAVAVAMSLSPQTLEWREDGKSAAGEISIFGRQRETAALAAPVTLGTGRDGGFSMKVKEEASVQGPQALEVISPSSPSKKYDLAELRAIAGSDSLSLSRLIQAPEASAAAVVVVASSSGALSVFSFAEISSSALSPSLDVSGAAPRLVAAPGRGLDDVVSIELRVFDR